MVPRRITIHCTDTPNGEFVPLDTIRGWHLKRGFSDIGYHFVIFPDGSIEAGRPFDKTGAHVAGENEDNIGIALEGRNKFTSAQFERLRTTILGIMKDYRIPIEMVYGHYQFPSAHAAGKTCPNMLIEGLREWILNYNTDAIEDHWM